jgi:hypothetical protein
VSSRSDRGRTRGPRRTLTDGREDPEGFEAGASGERRAGKRATERKAQEPDRSSTAVTTCREAAGVGEERRIAAHLVRMLAPWVGESAAEGEGPRDSAENRAKDPSESGTVHGEDPERFEYCPRRGPERFEHGVARGPERFEHGVARGPERFEHGVARGPERFEHGVTRGPDRVGPSASRGPRAMRVRRVGTSIDSSTA